ncbi:hypothetical protein EOB36_20010 [Mesorhizobium sp. M6A.T.Cr.TU.017.01.1.1]|nr:hypothetical protein EOB36_20010 [Mesorhizobium sp. M6A.T.Cr.TU.017.01.1.1]
MTAKFVLLSVISLQPATAASEEIYYGSRAGMSATVVSKSGIGTANAVIRVEHLPKNAKAYCVEYEQDNSMACVRRTMVDVKIPDRVSGNCTKKTWSDLSGRSYAFLGRHKAGDFAPDYAIKHALSGEILDGSSASGYGEALSVFQALCPGIAK